MKAAVVILIISALAASGSAYRFLALLPFSGKSHHLVFQPYLLELAKRGHHVDTVSHFPVTNPPANYTDISLVGMDMIHKEILDMKEFEDDMHGLAPLIRTFTTMFPLKQVSLNTCSKFVSWPAVQHLFSDNLEYDAVILESFNGDCMYGIAQRIQAPVITLLSHRFLVWSNTRAGSPEQPFYVPHMGTPYGNKMNVWERLFNTFAYEFMRYWFRNHIQLEEQKILEEKFGHKLPDLDELSRNTNLILVNTHHSFTGVQPHPPGVVEVNGWHLKKQLDNLEKSMETFIDSSPDGVIVFSFGSLLKSSSLSEEKQRIFIKVFSKFPQKVIWKWEGEPPKGAGSNIMFSSWIQQYELLQHPKVVAFIGHGGLLGMTEVVASGKPMLVIPMFGDQPTNAALAEEAGFAVKLEYFDITEDSLTEALTKVLSSELKANAKRVNEIWKDRAMDPMDEAIYWSEKVVRLGFDAKLLPDSRQMPYYQRAMLDVIAIVISALTIVLFLIYLIVKSLFIFIFRLVGYGCNKNTKEKIN